MDCATEALEKYNVEKDIASFIKKEMDKKYEIYIMEIFQRTVFQRTPNKFRM